MARRKDRHVKNGKNARSSGQTSQEHIHGLKQQLRLIGLDVRRIEGDGNCLFRALADQEEGLDDNHRNYRERICEFMMDNREHFEPFIEDDVTFDRHIKDLRRLGTHAGNEVLVAFAQMENLDVLFIGLTSQSGQSTVTAGLVLRKGGRYI